LRRIRWTITVLSVTVATTPLFLGASAGVSSARPEGTTTPRAFNPDWSTESDQQKAWLGYTVSGAGDVNADGYSDVIVGAYRYDDGEENEGKAWVYLGSATGISTTPVWSAEGNAEGAWFGHSVSTAGDVNGDGYDDIIVGAPNPTHGTTIGWASVYYGSPTGPSATPDWTAYGPQPVDWFGRRVHTAGDVNGDGYDDVIVGSPHYDGAEYDNGAAYVFYGSATGLSATPDWSAVGDEPGALFGRDGKTAGDVNGDGYDDVIVGAHMYRNGQVQEGRAFGYYGGANGLAVNPSWFAEGNQSGAWFGRSVATAGDVNADGYDDVVVGAPTYDNGQQDEGQAYLFLGSATGLSPTASWITEGNQKQAWYGRAVASAGDVNGDGYADLIIGAPNYDPGQVDGGKVFVYLGSPTGPATAPDWTASLNQTLAWFGRSVASARDVNGDGYGDVIIGAPQYDNGQTDEGGAFGYYGSPGGLRAGR
jgi:FG-GAP repeat